jgi:2-polyprenyl-6-methoxyphenol hydroxylase-like FAD-dependent oxidoreductase
MSSGNNPEVLVVGAGPVGLFSALALAKRGIRVRIVDRGMTPCAQSYALALHPNSIRLLKAFGLDKTVLESSRHVRALCVFESSEPRGSIRFGDENDPASCLAVIRQDVLESLLERTLADAGVRVEWRHEVPRLIPAPDRVDATIDKFEKESRGYVIAHTEWVVAKSIDLQVPFVIGADGHSSRVRRAMKIDFPEVGSAQYYAVFEFKTDADLGEARLMLGPGMTDVLWPLAGGYCRWGFELPGFHDEEAEKRVAGLHSAGFDIPAPRGKERIPAYVNGDTDQLDEAALRELISQRAPWFKGSIENLAWHSVVRFERRLAGSFGNGRMWLAGDAAHLTGPIGMQSMNIGLEEAHDLVHLIADVLQGREPLSILDGYNRRWTAAWRMLHALAGSVKVRDGANPWAAPYAKSLLSCLPGHGPELAAQAAQLGLTIESSAAAAGN